MSINIQKIKHKTFFYPDISDDETQGDPGELPAGPVGHSKRDEQDEDEEEDEQEEDEQEEDLTEDEQQSDWDQQDRYDKR
jgi:hypothetical protein